MPDVTTSNSATQQLDEEDRKRKVALLLSYCGADYHGMQKYKQILSLPCKITAS